MSNLSAAPAFEVTCLNTASAVGLLQMLPRHTKSTLVLPASAAIVKGERGSADRCPAAPMAAEDLVPWKEAHGSAGPAREFQI